jgi:hypothetical protein
MKKALRLAIALFIGTMMIVGTMTPASALPNNPRPPITSPGKPLPHPPVKCKYGRYYPPGCRV